MIGTGTTLLSAIRKHVYFWIACLQAYLAAVASQAFIAIDPEKSEDSQPSRQPLSSLFCVMGLTGESPSLMFPGYLPLKVVSFQREW